jgi:hypothetical protein
MALTDIQLDRITEQDLQRLIAAGAQESLYIDYKRQTYGNGEQAHAEYLADVSSFANTAGGDLVIGMEEQGGVPTAFVPFTGNPDDERRRLEDIARTGLEPSIRHLQARAVPIAAGGHVLVVRVPRSYLPPHRVTYKGRKRFYARASSGKYEPNVEELRRIFNDAPHLAERIQAFRVDRAAKITAGETPVPLTQPGTIVLHVVPVPSFADNRLIDVVPLIANGTHVPLPLDGLSGANRPGINLDGFLNYADNAPGTGRSYAQLFRSGVIEGVTELGRQQGGNGLYFVGGHFANKIVFAVRQYVSVLKSLNAGFPIYAFLSLCGASKCHLRYSPAGMGYNDVGPLGRDVVMFPEILIEGDGANVPALMRPVFNMVWNAFGFLARDMYDGQGQWRGTPRSAWNGWRR